MDEVLVENFHNEIVYCYAVAVFQRVKCRENMILIVVFKSKKWTFNTQYQNTQKALYNVVGLLSKVTMLN